MKNLMIFEEFCKSCLSSEEDKEFSGDMRKKAKRSRYKSPERDKERQAYMKELMKDRIKK